MCGPCRFLSLLASVLCLCAVQLTIPAHQLTTPDHCCMVEKRVGPCDPARSRAAPCSVVFRQLRALCSPRSLARQTRIPPHGQPIGKAPVTRPQQSRPAAPADAAHTEASKQQGPDAAPSTQLRSPAKVGARRSVQTTQATIL